MTTSKIEWTQATWNPIVGCSIVSPGCTNCYAMKLAARIQKINPTGDRDHSRQGGGMSRFKKAASSPESEFREWLERGPGEALLGGALKVSASNEKRRLSRKLEVPNLFPHIDHEDREALARADQAWKRGDRMVKRCQARSTAIAALLDANAGLRITDEDLNT